MEAGFATGTRLGALGGRSPLLRLQSDERLIRLLRDGNDAAFEVLFARYRTRLLAFCRHMLASKEDAEDILQEVFAAAYNAILADERAIHARPWLYRIARNRCLNHLRRPVPDGRDTMDDQLSAGGASTADVVHKRADLRNLLEDVQKLPETQRTALLLREIDSLSYDQIAIAMETTIPSVKSLLVRARMSLAEASEARQLTCDEVRMRLAEVAEGLRRATPPIKRHVRDCEDCARYRKELRKTSAAMAVVFPVAPLLALKKLVLAKAAAVAGGAGSGSGAAATGTVAGTAAGATGGAGAGGLAGGAVIGAAASKAVAGLAVTAIIAGGAVEANRATTSHHAKPSAGRPVQSIVHYPKQTTGGASIAGAAPALLEKAEASHKTKHVRKPKPKLEETAAAAGATGTTGSGGATSSGQSAGNSAAPVAGSGTGAAGPTETGGAAPPPPGAAPPQGASGSTAVQSGATGGSPPTGATSGSSPTAGATGATGTP